MRAHSRQSEMRTIDGGNPVAAISNLEIRERHVARTHDRQSILTASVDDRSAGALQRQAVCLNQDRTWAYTREVDSQFFWIFDRVRQGLLAAIERIGVGV